MLNKILKNSLLLIIALFGAGFLAVPMAYAGVVKPLTVEFQNTPLFNEVNFLPGDTVTRWIRVANNSGASQEIIIEAINVSDPNSFAPIFNLKIEESSTTIFDDTLANFFANSETILSSLADGSNTTYELKITFNPTANDDYQNKVLNNFDLLVGFHGQEISDSSTGGGTTNGGTGGSGGGGSLPPGLTIFNEANFNIQETSVIITWQTTYLSTSRVVYGTENEPHSFDLNISPNYGYAHSNVEDSNKVTYHQMELTGLTPDTVYYYRVISHASPDTISRNLSFKTQTPGQPPLPQDQELIDQQSVGNVVRGIVAGTDYNGEINSDSAQGLILGAQTDQSGQIKNDSGLPGPTALENTIKTVKDKLPEIVNKVTNKTNCGMYILVLVILNLIALTASWYRDKNGSNKLIKYSWLVALLLIITPAIIWYPACWLAIWLLVLLIISIIYLVTHKS